MKEVTLAASARSSGGKGAARRSRMNGNIPGIVYGPEVEPIPVEITEQAFRSAVKEASGTSALFNLDIDGKLNKVVIREIQRDPITSRVTHVDFHAISMNKPIHLSVPITFTGTAHGVKTDGGILQTTLRELEISCLPVDIPEHVEVDVTELGIGDSIHVRDLEVPKAKILSESQSTVVVVAAPTIIKVEVAEEVEEAVEGVEAEEGAEAAEAAPAEGKAEEGAKTEEKTEKKTEEKTEKKKKKKK